MSAFKIDGTAAVRQIHTELQRDVKALDEQQLVPRFATLTVGSDFASIASRTGRFEH